MTKKSYVINYVLVSMFTIYILLYTYDIFWLKQKFKKYKEEFYDVYTESTLNSIKKEKIDEYLNLDFYKNFINDINKIWNTSIELIIVFIFNVLFYSRKTRKILYFLGEKIIEIIDTSGTLTKDKTNILGFYFTFAYCSNLLDLRIQLKDWDIQYFFLFCFVVFFVLIACLKRKNKLKIKLLYAYLILIFYELRCIYKAYTISEVLLKESQNIPEFFTDKVLKLAEKYFQRNICYMPDGKFNAGSLYCVKYFMLIISGDYEDVTENNLLGTIGHESGHSSHFTHIAFTVLELALKILSIFIYVKIFTKYSKNIKSDDLSEEAITTFILIFNLPVFFILFNMGKFVKANLYELYADYFSSKIAPEGDFAGSLLIGALKHKSSIFNPFFYNLFNSTHPSTHLRTKLYEYYKSKK